MNKALYLIPVLFFLSLFFQPLWGLNEESFRSKIIEDLYPSVEEWSWTGFFKGVSNLQIHYRIYGTAQPQSRPVVISPGWTEFSLKYMELAHDLISQSFSPVYVLDHRGQGASGRRLSDPEKGYVEDFGFYVQDFKTFLDKVVIPRHPEKNLHLIAHSMGGAVSLLYMLEEPNTFRSAAMTSPMLQVAIHSCLEFIASLLSPPVDFLMPHQPFLVSSRKKEITFDPNNKVSHSPARYEFNKFLENEHSFYIKGATLKWLNEATGQPKQLVEQAEGFAVPLLILSGGQDQVVDNSAIYSFCERAKNCSHIPFAGAKHEILMEKDEIRTPALQKILQFFNSH